MKSGKDTIIDWKEITKSNKGVRTNDQQTCGNVIAEDAYSIIVYDGVINIHEFLVPKSKVDYYDGSEVHLNVPYDILSAVFEVKSK
ncbi:MAG TPA: hypothetical protein VE244_14500 [Nitrososphaeraceae archaeon]|jgi:hypothetical protein|nr:hypothetical protein [Nitrososphaeraceae archaeon]